MFFQSKAIKPISQQQQTTFEQSPPSTPKKKSQYIQYQPKQQQPLSRQPKIKYKYIITQKPTNSSLTKLSFFIWLSLILVCIYLSYQTKILNLESSIQQQIKQCQLDYNKNKCDTPVKAVKQYCNEKDKCMNANRIEILKLRTKNALFLGELIKQFLEGLGLPVFVIGLLYMLIANRKAKQTKKQFIEYYP